MKKNILLIAAALFLFLGNQSITAQAKMEKETQSISAEETEVSAKEKTTSLIRSLGLNKKQQEQVYNLFVKSEEKMSRASLEGETKEKKMKEAKMNEYIMAQMKEILTEGQFKNYLELVKNQ